VLYVHVLHFTDVESLRRDVLRLERLAVRAFGTKEQRAEVERVVAAWPERPTDEQAGTTSSIEGGER